MTNHRNGAQEEPQTGREELLAVGALRYRIIGDDGGVQSLKATNLALKFLMELAAIAAFGYWGATTASGAWAILLAIAAPGAAVLLWGLFAAPKSAQRLPPATRIPFELAVFGLAALALFAADSSVAAIILVLVAILNSLLLTVFDQWAQ
jgi:Protein of unknown function (DUF2568)